MPDTRPEESPAGHAPAGLSPFTRDDPRYWLAKPSDHGPNGLYLDGPQEALPVTARLVAPAPIEFAPEREKAPVAERRALSKAAVRASRLRRALAGQFAPVRRRAD